ncbi:hypothetical protein AMEX_G20864 [Astyanax mexicanus]|uniref:Uncharacterized protein n=1 Tax=Astyanax mexicanus TaxID=7994 RepID=A0A8T2L5L3_ASTMX|nr:hypothetical protein AMEX_G20864 [Astyanax mexicanus]
MSSLPPSRRSSGVLRVSFDSTVNKNPSYERKELERHTEDLHLEEPPQHLNSTTTPCILHPCLTPGQKRYLFTAAKAHSKDHVRKLICQHYLNVLHRSTSTGVDHTRDIAFINPPPDPELHPTAEEKSRGSGRDAGGGKAKGKAENRKRLILPKINSHRKRSRPHQKSNARKSTPLRRNRHRGSVGLSQWEMDEDSLVSELSSLSLENEDFLFT